jgi:transcriptional regulator with XRE-family HTH domain
MARTSPRRTTPSPGSSTFCYRVKRWRSYLGVTQRRFAELWGVSPSLVQKIEADDYSVSQLSFERLETLRTLLKLPSTTFYGLIATHPDLPAERADSEQVQVRRLEPGLPPLVLPRTLLEGASAAQLVAFAIAPEDFAPDRLRYSLREGALLIFDPARHPDVGEVCVFTARHRGQTCRVLAPYSPEAPIFLRPFDPESDAVLELGSGDLEPLGVVIASWTPFSTH